MQKVQLLTFLKLISNHRRPVLTALGTLMLAIGSVAFGVSTTLPDPAQWPVRQVVQPVELAFDAASLSASKDDFLIHQSEFTRRDDTLQTLLKRLGVDDPDARRFLASDATSRLMLMGPSGKLASVTRTPVGRLRNLTVLWVDSNGQRVSRLVVESREHGYTSRLERPTPRQLVQFGSFNLSGSFYAAADRAGIPDAIAAQVVEAFSGDIDLQRDLQRGAHFSLVYEAFELGGELLFTGQLLGAEVKNGKDIYQVMWFQEAGKAGEFVSLDGRSRRRTFLASPLAYSRVTSVYGPRIHPVSGSPKYHKGADYGAPAGTPVRTVADGEVTFAGRKGGYGNYVVIRHSKTASTAYAHLERVAVRAGQRVQQGQNIGTVGSTGMATGPNLHFEYFVKGASTDPTRIVSTPSSTTSVTAHLPSFQRESKAMREQLGIAFAVSLASAQ